MDIKQVFSEMTQKLAKLNQHYMKGEIPASDFEEGIHAFHEKSDEILENWMLFEDHLASFTSKSLIAPSFLATEWKKAKALYDLLMFDQAIAPLEQIVQEESDFEQARLYLAHAYLACKQLDKAKYHLQFLLKTSQITDVKHLSAHALGCIEGAQQAYEPAEAYFQKISVDQVRSEWKPIIMYNHAQTLYHMGKNQESIAKLKFYYECVPDDWKGPFMLGKIHHEMGEEAEGFVYWFEALQRQDNTLLLKEMAQQFEQKTHYKMAIHCYKRIMSMEAHCLDIHVWFGLAWNYGMAGYRDKSKAVYIKALSLFPKNLELQISYVWMLLLWQEHKQATQAMLFLQEHYPDQPLIEGLHFLQSGQYQQAYEFLEEATLTVVK